MIQAFGGKECLITNILVAFRNVFTRLKRYQLRLFDALRNNLVQLLARPFHVDVFFGDLAKEIREQSYSQEWMILITVPAMFAIQ